MLFSSRAESIFGQERSCIDNARLQNFSEFKTPASRLSMNLRSGFFKKWKSTHSIN